MDKWTPLHSAAWFGYTDIIPLLLDHGANVNIKDKVSVIVLYGFTAYDLYILNNDNNFTLGGLSKYSGLYDVYNTDDNYKKRRYNSSIYKLT